MLSASGRASSAPTTGVAPATGVAATTGVAAASSVDVLFGQAYFLRFDPKLWEARQPYAPLGALYAAACVRQHGYTVALFDAIHSLGAAAYDAELLADWGRPRTAEPYL